MGKSHAKAEEAQPAPGADNNKHLAYLEAGVSGLALAIAAAGIELKEGDDPLAQATEIVARWKELTLARAELAVAVAAAVGVSLDQIVDPLEAAKGALQSTLDRIAELEDAAKAGPNGATDGELAAIARAEKAEADLEQAKNRIAELECDGGDDGEALEPHAVDRQAIAATADAPRLSTDDLRILVDEGQSFQLVFSDGAIEISAIGAIEIPARDLHRHSGRYVVAAPIAIKGLTAEETIDGAALFHGDEQVSYCKFEPTVTAKPGEVREFNRAIAFG